jgi:hypothetical protein
MIFKLFSYVLVAAIILVTASCSTTQTGDPGKYGYSLRINGEFVSKEFRVRELSKEVGIVTYASYRRQYVKEIKKGDKSEKVTYWVPTGESGNIEENWENTTALVIDINVENPKNPPETYRLIGILEEDGKRTESILVSESFADLRQYIIVCPLIKNKKVSYKVKIEILNGALLEQARTMEVAGISYNIGN